MKREIKEHRISQLEHQYAAYIRAGRYARAQALKPRMERERRKLAITCTDETIEAARQSGALGRIGQRLSAVQLLSYVANNLVEEAAEEFRAAGLHEDAIISLHRSFTKAADNYFNAFASLVRDKEKKMDMFADFDEFDRLFRRWAKLDGSPG